MQQSSTPLEQTLNKLTVLVHGLILMTPGDSAEDTVTDQRILDKKQKYSY